MIQWQANVETIITLMFFNTCIEHVLTKLSAINIELSFAIDNSSFFSRPLLQSRIVNEHKITRLFTTTGRIRL